MIAAQERAKGLGATILFTYSSAVIGFSMRGSPEAVQTLRALPGVDFIEADQKMSINSTTELNPPAV